MKGKTIHITFIIPSLAAGGAERILSFVANHMNTEQFTTTLLVVGFESDTVYDTHDLNVIYLNKTRVLSAFFDFIRYFRTEKPDVVVSSIFHLNTLIAFLSIFFPNIKFVAREANVLSVLNKYSGSSSSSLPKFLVVFAYKLVDRLICQSKDMQDDMVNNYGVSLRKTVLINNPITNTFRLKSPKINKNEPLQLITIGRLSREKGHDRIVEVLSRLKFSFHYTMIGNGNEKDTIFNLIKEKGIEDKITHITYTKEVEKYLSQSDIFLQGSYSEGLPNALIESCVIGTPIVAFKAPGGLNEIIEEGKNGTIVESIDDCVEVLTRLNVDFNFLPKDVNEVVSRKFNSQKIIAQYETLFIDLTKN